jgi:hypothetical protein
MKQTIHSLLFACIAGLMASCGSTTAEVEEVALPVLRPSYIYDNDSVYAYITNYGAEHAITAAYYIKKADKIVEQDPKKAIWNIKRAITLHPKLEYYKKLAPLLMQTENYSEACQLYGLIADEQYMKNDKGKYVNMYVFDRPSEDDFYNYLLCSTLKHYYFPDNVIYDARENGFDIQKLKQRLLSDERYKYDTGSIEFKNNMLAFLSEDEIEAYCDQPENFYKFLARIPDTSSVFVIDQQAVAKFDYTGFYDGSEEGGYSLRGLEMHFLKEKKNDPDNWLVYNCNHVVRLNDQVYVIEYSIDTSAIACPKEMRHVAHMLATYTPEGKIIDAKPVAWQSAAMLASMSYDNGKVIDQYLRAHLEKSL